MQHWFGYLYAHLTAAALWCCRAAPTLHTCSLQLLNIVHAMGSPPEGVFGLSQEVVAQIAGAFLVVLFIGAILSRRS